MEDDGWLLRSMQGAREEVAKWPDWKKEAFRVLPEEEDVRAEQRKKREAVLAWWDRRPSQDGDDPSDYEAQAYLAARKLDSAADWAKGRLAIDLRAAASRAWDALYWHLRRTRRLGDTKA